MDLPGGNQALGELFAVVIEGMVLAWLADPAGSDPDQVLTLPGALLERTTAAPATAGGR